MRYTLLHSGLVFISLGTGKIHAQSHAMNPPYNEYTLCGIAVPSGAEERPQRSLGDAVLCGRCRKSLGSYQRQHVHIEQESEA
jgi:hypothetical protein